MQTLMKAVVGSSNGPILRELAMPELGDEFVLVKIHAAALNRADLNMLRGASHGKVGGGGAPLGLEWAGEVVGLGDKVGKWKLGDKVMAAGGKAFAEYTTAHQHLVYSVPDNCTFAEAATLPVALQTSHDALITHGGLKRGQSVLVQGASSAVGLMTMQIAKYLGAKTVFGTSTTPQRLSRLAQYGADIAVNSQHSNWLEDISRATEGNGVDVTVDYVAGALANANLEATRVGGRLINVGRLGGLNGDFNFDLHALRRITYVGVTFRTRSRAEVEEIIHRTQQDLMPALNDGLLRLPIFQRFALDEINQAFEVMAKNQHFGKLVVNLT